MQVRSDKGYPVGVGYYNDRSEIVVRLLTFQDTLPEGWLRSKVEAAAAWRKRFVRDTDACRIVASEADGLPGLIVDLYGETAVVQFLTLGMERLREPAVEAVRSVLGAETVYERSDAPSRQIEGLEPRTGWIGAAGAAFAEVREGKVRYKVHFEQGHKTGLYLDQRENRMLLASMGLGARALDVFCYEGGFGLHLALSGCRVTGIDAQADAIARAEENRSLNGLTPDQLRFKTANAFDELKALEKAGERFDQIILDPPSFVRRKEALEGAVSGYKELILRSMKLLEEGGFLSVYSCSYHMDEHLLLQTSMAAAWDTRKDLRVVRFLRQSQDHPIHPFVPETYYLKGFLFQVKGR
ncbi:MAG: Ribosomal RNA large subunit methyltransferase I [Candidatus Omnitrophica bacterium]|nr:Ribosomal RNA large subunit methyltransferase I [Candidatus Omnitrophota bacterium]